MLVTIGVLMVLGLWRTIMSWAGVFLSGFTSTL
jgi:hypothetical protein